MINDLLIQQEVLRNFGEQHLPAGEIGVEVHHGVVKLAGRVSDLTAKKCAELAARSVKGVSSVILDLNVAAVRGAPRLVRNL